MGINDHQERKRSKRGSTDNAGRLAALFGRTEGKVGKAEWASADARWILAVITAVTARGGAVTFGLSRDQGAHMLTLLLDGERETLWFNGDADLDLELEKVYQLFNTL